MSCKRLIARIDVKGANAINTIRMEGLRVVGNPNILAKKYYDDGADEILLIDQVASLYGRNHLAMLTKDFVRNVFIPITVGGGIRSVEDARKIFLSGADKVAVNTEATRRPLLIKELAESFGAQSIVISIQAKKVRNEERWEVYRDGGREKTGIDVLEWAEMAVDMGAGEILVTSIDQDGTRRGFDIDLVRRITQAATTPVIASGGMGSTSDAVSLLELSDCDGFAVADYLHMERGGGFSEIREKLRVSGFEVRENK